MEDIPDIFKKFGEDFEELSLAMDISCPSFQDWINWKKQGRPKNPKFHLYWNGSCFFCHEPMHTNDIKAICPFVQKEN